MSIIKEKAKNKIHENIIGKIIYGFLLFAPLLAILTTVLIDTFNMNAKNQYTYKYETNEVGSTSDLIVGNMYHLKMLASNRPTQTERIYVEDVINLQTTGLTTYSTSTASDIPNFAFTSNNSFYYFYTHDSRYYGYSISGNIECDFVYRGNSNFTKIEYISKCKNLPITKVESIDANEVFYTALETIEEKEIFNWAKSTALYTGLRTTCQSLGIENTFTPMLMAYWLLISIIYFIFDIGLIMVHIVHRKIHEFTESV